MRTFTRILLAELLGTYLLVFFGCGAVHASVLTGAQSGLWQVAIIWGLAVAFAAYCVGGISGAHINPAISLSLAWWGRFSWSRLPGYVLAQVLGALLAAATLYAIYAPQLKLKEQEKGVMRGSVGSIVTAMCYGEFYPSPGPLAAGSDRWTDEAWEQFRQRTPWSMAFGAEVVGTAILALVVFAVGDPRHPSAPPSYLAPLVVGLVVAALISVIAPLTQCCLNPARDFGPRLFTYLVGWGTAALPGPNGHGWFTVYILAPSLGAVLGGAVYERLLRTT
jgi:glycerol uptake facilitator protein